jgi:hypothetical protein
MHAGEIPARPDHPRERLIGRQLTFLLLQGVTEPVARDP